jgi:hypothetical protein
MKKIGVAAFSILALAGCTTGVNATEDAAPEPATTQGTKTVTATPKPVASKNTVDLATTKAIREYVNAVAAQSSPEDMLAARKYTLPGSVADGYLRFQSYGAESALDGGLGFTDWVVSPSGGNYKVCEDQYDTASCNTFGNFKVWKGQVTNFTVDGKEIGPRLTMGAGKKVTDHGVSVEFLGAYKSVSGNLNVSARVKTEETGISLNSASATYRAPDGKQREASGSAGPYEIAPNSSSTTMITFPGVDAGGTVTLNGYLDTDDFIEFEVKFNVGK